MKLIYKGSGFKGGRNHTFCPESLPKSGEDEYFLMEFADQHGYAGSIVLCKTRWDFWETHSELREDLHGKGYGLKMYEMAIRHAKKKGWSVRSSTKYSDQARNVWLSKRLRKKYKIKKQGRRFLVTE